MKNSNMYFFDKRILKKFFLCYLLPVICCFPLLAVLNFFVEIYVGNVAMIFIDVAIILIILLIVGVIRAKIISNKAKRGK